MQIDFYVPYVLKPFVYHFIAVVKAICILIIKVCFSSRSLRVRRTKGKANKDGSLAQFGYRPTPAYDRKTFQDSDHTMETVSSKTSRQSWALLIQKVYEVDPLGVYFVNYTVSTQNVVVK